jgi:DMSO/TMAO reductase YedYZ molybdopterin-dependent catalytic subunit
MTGIARLLGGLALAMLLLAGGRPAGAQTLTFSPSFRLDGDVATPKVYTLHKLEKLPPTKLDVFFYTGAGPVSATYTGVLLWDLLADANVLNDPTVKNDVLRKEVVVTGSDGYVSVFSLGELDPMFGGEQVIVAYELNGAPVTDDTGFASIVVPGDKAGGRYVHAVTSIKVTASAK